jgi:hypothetical protein
MKSVNIRFVYGGQDPDVYTDYFLLFSQENENPFKRFTHSSIDQVKLVHAQALLYL